MSNDAAGPGPRGKVERLLEAYGIEEFGDYLLERWTAEESEERRSLRELAREFNIRLVEASLGEQAMGVDGQAARYYRQLTEEGVSSGVRTEAKRSLEQSGVDVDALLDDFVSRQAIHTYLTGTRGASKPEPDGATSTDSVLETIERLRERSKQVTASRVRRLRDAGRISIGSFRVVVDIQVYCLDCGQQLSVSDLLATGHCNCAG